MESVWANPISTEKWRLLVPYQPRSGRYEDAKQSIYHWLDEYGFENLKRGFRSEKEIYSRAITVPSAGSRR